MTSDSSIVFPFRVALGPYDFGVEFVPKNELKYKNRNWENELNQQVIRIAHHIYGSQLLETFLCAVIGLMHYTHGVDDSSTEENFTHSFATGMLEFASRNPEAWGFVNSMLSQLSRSKYRFERVALGRAKGPEKAPCRVVIGPRTVRLSSMSYEASERTNAWGWYHYEGKDGNPKLEVYEGLAGRHRPVVVLHELTHAFHHRHGLDDKDSRRRFVRAQARSLMEFARENPTAWSWLIADIHRTHPARLHNAA